MRTSALPAAASCRRTCFILARSTARRSSPGENRSKSSTKPPPGRAPWRCFPRMAARPSVADDFCRPAKARRLAARAAAPMGRLLAGAVGYGKSCSSIASLPSACRRAAKARAGPTCSSCSSPIGCSRPAANGGCIANGSSPARLPISSAATSASPNSTSSTACHDRLLEYKEALFQHLGRALAGICSMPASTCCSTI